MKNQKTYKPHIINIINMLPSDLTGSLDDHFLNKKLFLGSELWKIH